MCRYLYVMYIIAKLKFTAFNTYSVNKHRIISLLFSSMFCIERQIVHVGTE